MRRLRSEGTRGKILDASAKVVVREGIWSTTTRKIAAEAGINVATLHYHFENKEALLFALFGSIIAAIRQVVGADYPEATPLAERIDTTFTRSWEAMETHLQEQILQVELTLYSVRSEAAHWLGKRQYDEFITLYADILRGASDVAGRPELDLMGLSRFFISALDGALMQHLADPDAERSRGLIRRLSYLAQLYPLTDPASPGGPVTAQSLRQERATP